MLAGMSTQVGCLSLSAKVLQSAKYAEQRGMGDRRRSSSSMMAKYPKLSGHCSRCQSQREHAPVVLTVTPISGVPPPSPTLAGS